MIATITPKYEIQGTNKSWSEEEVDGCADSLLNKPSELLHLIKDRGLHIDTIKKHKIGIYSPGIYTLPVYDKDNVLVNMRYYRRSDHRKWGVKGKSAMTLFPLSSFIVAPKIWICEGEFDVLIACQNDLPAISANCGAPAMPTVFKDNKDLFPKDTRFILAFDNDQAGWEATARIGLDVFYGKIDGIIRWPDDKKKGYDISDWFSEGNTAEELKALIVPFEEDWAYDLLNRAKPGPGSVLPSGEVLVQGEPGEQEDAYSDPETKDSFPTDAMPEGGFLGRYMKYAKYLAPFVPDQFNAVIALTNLGATIGRRMWVQKGPSKIFANFYSLIVGPSGCGKTTALNCCNRIVKRFRPGLYLPNEFSGEKFIQIMSQQPNGLIEYSEMTTLLNLTKRGYAEGVIDMLTNMYDCPDLIKAMATLKNAETQIKNVHLSILGACTSSTFKNRVTLDKAESGFWMRFILCPAKRHSDEEQLQEPIEEEEVALTNELANLFVLNYELKMTKEAQNILRAWVKERSNVKMDDDTFFLSVLRRMTDYCIKIAMLLELGKYNVITDTSMAASVKICDWLLSKMMALYGVSFVDNKALLLDNKILSSIHLAGGKITLRDLSRKLGLRKEEIIKSIDTLVLREYVIQRMEGTGGLPKLVFILTQDGFLAAKEMKES